MTPLSIRNSILLVAICVVLTPIQPTYAMSRSRLVTPVIKTTTVQPKVTTRRARAARHISLPDGTSVTLLTGKHTVILHLNKKTDVTMELDADMAPLTVTNFIELSKQGYYDGLTIHRIIPGFVFQGGDPNGNGTGGTSIYGETFKDEIDPNAKEVRGVVAMANRGPDTNGSQFFILLNDSPWLDGHYSIFGKVTDGMDAVDTLSRKRRDANDKPLIRIVITSVEVKD